MLDKFFLDTNVLIYLYSEDEPTKQAQALNCTTLGEIWISTQVLNETINVLRRKFALKYPAISAVVNDLTARFQIVIVSPNTIQCALILAERYHYQYFDSLMLASALEISCIQIFSEDLQHGQVIDSTLTIFNPFQIGR